MQRHALVLVGSINGVDLKESGFRETSLRIGADAYRRSRINESTQLSTVLLNIADKDIATSIASLEKTGFKYTIHVLK